MGASLGDLNCTIIKEEKDIPRLRDTTMHSQWLGPKKLVEPASFSVTLKKMMSASMLPESPYTKKVRHPQPKYSRFSILLLHVFCNIITYYVNTLRKQNKTDKTKRTMETLQNMLNF